VSLLVRGQFSFRREREGRQILDASHIPGGDTCRGELGRVEAASADR
jgi:hypothetical protein